MVLNQDTELQGGKYRIVRVIGQGGFGITYLAENIYFNKFVAIKEFFPKEFCGRGNTSRVTLGTVNNAETVAKLKARFLKEAQNIAKLDNPGIVKIHDIFEENDTAYYVMDYIDGENLNEMVKRNGPLSETKALEYIRKVGDALDYIHSRNMTHFDVKPANIVVRKSDDIPILIDFGLSKQYDRSGDATSTMMQGVSQGYSPIELYYSGQITSFSPKTDVYSLGATFYYLVTGSVPPAASQIIEDGITVPSTVSSELRTAINKLMSPTRRERPENAIPVLESIHLASNLTNAISPPASVDNEDTELIGDNKKEANHTKPLIIYFNANKSIIKEGETVTFTWSTSFAEKITISKNSHPRQVSSYGTQNISFNNNGEYRIDLCASNIIGDTVGSIYIKVLDTSSNNKECSQTEQNYRRINLETVYQNNYKKSIHKSIFSSFIIILGFIILAADFIYINSIQQPYWGLLILAGFFIITLGACMFNDNINTMKSTKRNLDKLVRNKRNKK